MEQKYIKGARLGIFTEDLVIDRNYPLEGWFVTDSGYDEQENGFYLIAEVRGKGGARRSVGISLSAEALRYMLSEVSRRENSVRGEESVGQNFCCSLPL